MVINYSCIINQYLFYLKQMYYSEFTLIIIKVHDEEHFKDGWNKELDDLTNTVDRRVTKS